MKSFKYNLIVVVALALFASCNKEKPSSGGTADGIGFVAKTEQGDGNSKTHGVIDGTSLVVKWTAYDKIKVAVEDDVAAEHQYTFELTEGEDNTSGTFYTGIPHPEESFFDESIHNYVAVYPAANRGDEANSITSANASSAVATFKLSDTQDYSEASFGEKAAPMMAHSTDKTLQFKNIMGGLCFLLHGDAIVTKVELTTKADEALWGTCTATLSGIGGEATISNITTANTDPAHATTKKTVTLDCGSGVELNSTPKKFYIMLPPGTLGSGFTMTVKGKDETSGTERVLYSHDGSIGSKGTITRNSILRATGSVYLKKGAIDAAFSVSATEKVYFSKGNLQYQATTETRRFAENQYDYIGSDNTFMAQNYGGWIDLFGWGTSGYEHGATGWQSWRAHPNDIYYYAYGVETKNLSDAKDDGTMQGMADWGYKPISNGGNTENQWRTLTHGELQYLKAERTNFANLFGEGRIGSVNGCILLPDNWTLPDGLTFTQGNSAWTNVYTTAEWAKMEAAGAIFLPAAGYRDYVDNATVVNDVGDFGGYWTSTHFVSTNFPEARCARYFRFKSGEVTTDYVGDMRRHHGLSVRLVHDVPVP